MRQLSIICESPAKSEDISKLLSGSFDVELVEFAEIHNIHSPGDLIVVDIDLKRITRILMLKESLKRRPKGGKLIVVIDKSSHLESIRAHAIGANDVVHRPIDGKTILSKLGHDFSLLACSSPEFEKSEDAVATLGALQEIFSSACLGISISATAINTASQPVMRHIETNGLGSWIDTVRQHHSITYQHSLLVTGVAVSFGLYLGFSPADRQRLSVAGMLHDIGKARMPLAILEKQGPLDEEETAIMRQHPQYGVDAIGATSDIDPKMIDMVLHHHEYLDGSGYPHGLGKSEISDFVRMMTIADIFSALIERRSYRPPLLSQTAYKMMLEMNSKLDKDLIREFRFISDLRLEAA